MTESLRGQILASARNLRDPNFFKTVVLMVEHNASGSMGLVVNRPSGVTVAEALAKHFELPETDNLVYVGGPVEENALFILHNSQELDYSETPLIPDLFIGSSAEVFETVVRRVAEGDHEVKFRVFSGCAGWAPGQLEGELARNDWYVCPATSDMVFHPRPYEVWDQVVQEYRRLNPILPNVQLPGNIGNPELN